MMKSKFKKLFEMVMNEPEDYRGEHGAPDSESGAPLSNVTKNGIYPDESSSSLSTDLVDVNVV